MSCKFDIQGDKFSENQLETIISGNLSLASIKTDSGQAISDRLKNETSDRFVNADLFTDYQEKSYIRQITAEVVNSLNILRPGQEITKSPAQAFQEVKSFFSNARDEVNYLKGVINTQEKLDKYKANPAAVEKFKLLNVVNSVDQFEEISTQYDNVLGHWDKFLDQVKMQILKYGISIKGEITATANVDDTIDAARDAANEDNPDQVEISDREISESYEDGRSFQMNPRDTASARTKIFLFNIPDVTRNSFGIREFADPDMVMEDILRVGSELENINYDSFVKALQAKYPTRPYLKNLVAKLAQVKADNNNQLINEILTFANKSYQEHIQVLYSDKDGGMSVKVIKSNGNSVVKQITRDWLEQQKSSDITVKTDNGELMINSAKVKELTEGFDAVRSKAATVAQKKAWVKTFMNTIGVKDFDDNMVDDLVIRAGEKFFSKERRNLSFDAMFEDNNFFSNVLNTYAKIPTGMTESKYDDVNNGMKDESFAFNKLAQIYHDHNPTKYQTGNSQNSEGKSIYAYIQKSYLENLKKKITGNAQYLEKLLGRSFSKSSEAVSKLRDNVVSGVKNYLFEFDYMDGMRKDKRNSDGVVRKNMSTKEQLFDTIQKHQNEGQRIGYYNLFTLSDKTQTPTITTQKYVLNDSKLNRAGKDLVFTTTPGATFQNSFNFKQDFKNQLFKLAQSEIDRITDYVNHPDKSSIDIKNFDKAYQFFYLFPILNSSSNEELNAVKAKLFTPGETLTDADTTIIKEVLTDSFKNSIESTYNKWIANDIIVQDFNEDGELTNIQFPLFNTGYMASKEVAGLSQFQKAIYAIADLKFNHLKAQVNGLQLLGADPALFYKFPKTGADRSKTFDQYTDIEKLNIVLSTMDEFSKRAAMFIAPGSQGVWTWNDAQGNIVDKQKFNTVTLKDFIRTTDLFKNIEVTDAQEFITLQEHIDRLMAEGKITDSLWNSITDKIRKSNGEYFRLSPQEMKLVVQPTKPVYTNNTDISSFPRIDYIKSSTYVMIPEIVAGSELDKLRRWMEGSQIQSAHFETTKKTGQARNSAVVFDEEGNFVTPTSFTPQTLDREGLHTQQEIPYQKDHITNVSQMNRTLFDGLLKVKNFTLNALNGKVMTGKQFKDLKENVRIAQFNKAKDKTIAKLGIKQTATGYIINNQKLVDMLREEAIKPSSGFSINDINAIKLDESGEFSMPIYLMPRGEKFEGLLNSIINKNVMLKNPGTSLVQVSSVGTNKMSYSALSDQQKSGIIWTEHFDPKKGLQYLRKKDGKVLPAQIIMSQFIKDADGNLINLQDFMYETDGMKLLDMEKIPQSVLQLVGSRIPNQSHPSMLPIEIVGFLPEYMESTVIVPDGITAQMGSDFDVDKLYAYTSNLDLNMNGDTLDSVSVVKYDISDYDDSHQSLSRLNDSQLEQLYRDIHWSVITHPSTFDKITKSIDFNDVKDEVTLLDSIGLYTTDMNVMPFDFENQMQVFNDNKGGKVGVGIFASLGSFLADNQDKDIFLGNIFTDEKGAKTVVTDPVKIRSKDGRVLDLFKVTEQGQVGKGDAQRTKGDNNNVAMTEAVDNAKNKNMYRFNWHPKVLNAVAAFISLSTEDGEIHDMSFATRFFPQAILQEYVGLIENAQDSLSTFQGDIKEVINKKLTDKYLSKMSDAGRAAYESLLDQAAEDSSVEVHEIFGAERLLNLLETSVKIKNGVALPTGMLDNYYKAQLSVLQLYNRLDTVGSELSTVIGASYIYTKGIGRNIFSVTDNIRKLSKLADSKVFLGLDQIAGKVTVDGTKVSLDPVGEIGHSINNSLFFARDLYKEIFPIHFSGWFTKTVDTILTNNGVDKQKVGSEKYIRLHKKIFNGVRSFMFSDPSMEIFENINEERTRLLMDTENNKSLATRITEARVSHPELLDNYFVKRLGLTVSLRAGEPSLVRYSNSFSADIDELANNRGFLSLVFSKDQVLQDIAKDLLRYTYATGNNETTGGFAKFIPIEYTLSDPDFLKGLGKIDQVLAGNGNRFIRQFMQNDPNMAKVLNEEQFAEITKNAGSKESLNIPTNSVTYEKILVNTTFEERQTYKEFKKLPDYITFNDYKNNQTLLYVKVGDAMSNNFKRINTLGTSKSGFVEFSAVDDEMTSIIFNNLTNEQKLDKILTNPNNVFQGSQINLISRIREVAMADVSTKFIGKKVPGGTDTKSYIDITADVWKASGRNNTEYTSEDTVMVIGTNGFTAKPNGEYISATELQEHFNTVYKPYIDKAIDAGASFTVGKFSGTDEIVGKYLKSRGMWETNTGLGYSKYDPRPQQEIEVSLDDMPDYDMDSLSLDDMQEPNFDNVDLETLSMDELPTPNERSQVLPQQEFFTRSAVEADTDYIYLFTDNAKRTSGRNAVDPNSAYAREYGTGKNYPGTTQAVVRGLDNAFPITTMVDDQRTQWNDNQFDQYKTLIDAEVARIKENLPNYKGIKYGSQMPFGQGQISNMKTSAPRIWEYMNTKLAELGIDNLSGMPLAEVPKPATIQEPSDEFPDDMVIMQDPILDLEDLVDPNDLLDMDRTPEEDIDLDAMNQTPAVKGVDQNSIISDDLKRVFEATPEISKIGTIEEYNQYVKNIFPNSKVKDILAHSSWNQNIETFDTVRQGSNFLGAQQFGSGVYFSPLYLLDYWRMELGMEENTDGRTYFAVVNASNPFTRYQSSLADDQTPNNADIILANDLRANNTSEYVVKDSSIIHILGSKNDIIGFQRFKANNVTTTNKTTELKPTILTGNDPMNLVLAKIWDSTNNPFYKNLIDIFRNRKAGIPTVPVIIDRTIENPGMYVDGTILINPELAVVDDNRLSESQNLENVIMHEVTHAYTAQVISDYANNKNNLTDKELVFAKSLDNLFKDTVQMMSTDDFHSVKLAEVLSKIDQGDATLSSKDKSMYYGLTNVHEFAAMLLTDPGFQQFMNTVHYDTNKNMSIFEQFKELFTKLLEALSKSLGIQVREKSVLSQGVTDVISMIKSSELQDLSLDVADAEVNDSPFDLKEIITDPKQSATFDPYKINTPKGLFDVNDDQRVAIDKVSEFFNKPATGEFQDDIFLVYGAGGTGKTAVASNAINKAIKDSSKAPSVGFAAVTHTAKGELRNAGNEEAKTLASMLGALPRFEDGVEIFELVPYEDYLRDEKQLPEIFNLQWLVIDEASMLGQTERDMIQQRIREKGSPLKILFMGDHAQIPPVGEAPDRDGFAIDLRKGNQSAQLVKIERTKNVDIADMGNNYRRAVDHYNAHIETTGSSLKSGLPTSNIVTVDKRVSSENVMFTSNTRQFVDKFIELFKKDPMNPRHAIIISYNNENHPSTVQVTDSIRKSLFGEKASEELFLAGEPISIKSTINAKLTDGSGTVVELGTNERVFIKSIEKKMKTFNVGNKYQSRNISAPVYEINAFDKQGRQVKFDSLDKSVTSQFTAANYDKPAKGYRMADGSIFKYQDKKALEQLGLTDIYHSYMVSAHKVQGQTYNHSFVAEKNIAKYVGMNDGKGGMILTPKSYSQLVYTAVSRAREKVYILSENVSSQQGNFVDAIVTPLKLNSVATRTNADIAAESTIRNDYELTNQCN